MSRNVLNVPDVDEYVAGLGEGRSEHINKWLKTIFRRHLLQVHPSILTVMDERELNSPWLDIFTSAFKALMDRLPRDDPDDEEDEDDGPRRRPQPAKKEEPFSLRTVAGKVCYMVKVDQQPEWVQQAIANRERLVFVDINRMPVNKHRHMVDWLATLPDREIRYLLPDVAKEIALWDKRLANQKLMQSLSEGTEEMASAVIHDYEPEKLKIVKLITKSSYVAEGAIMKHCVGGPSYFGRAAVMIFSLRRVDAEEDAVPIATIEVTNKSVRQIKARFNQRPTDEYLELLKRWQAEQGFNQPIKKKSYAQNEDDEDDGDDDEDDGDWDDDEDEEEGVPNDDESDDEI